VRGFLVIVLGLAVFLGTSFAQAVLGPLPPTPLEEAVAKIKPAIGVLYREVNVYDEKGTFVRSYLDTGGTLTAIVSAASETCAATVAHSVEKKDEVVRRTSEEVVLPDRTKRAISLTHRFSGRYLATFDGVDRYDAELLAFRGGAGLFDDFAVFRVPVGKLPAVEFGNETMVRQGSAIFMMHSPIGIIGTFTNGYVGRQHDDPYPRTGPGLPILKRAYVLDIRMTHGSSGAFAYVLRGNTGYAFSMLVGYFYVGTAGGQLGSDFPNALGITQFKKFLEDEKIFEKCAR